MLTGRLTQNGDFTVASWQLEIYLALPKVILKYPYQ